MIDTHPLVLSLRSAGLKDVDPSNMDEVHYMWNAFSKAKNCIDGGDRLEYLSWRIYSREVLRMQNAFTPAVIPDGDQDQPIQNPEQSDSEYNSDDEWENASITNDESINGDTEPAVTKQKSNGNLAGNSSQVSIRRRLSSVELQHLFKDTIQIDPKIKADSKYLRRHTSPVVSNASSSSSNSSSGYAEDVDTADEHKSAVHAITKPQSVKGTTHSQAREHIQPRFNHSWCHYNLIPEATYQQGDPRTFENTKSIPSPVVRGFNPSSVSVSVHRHSIPDIRDALLTSLKDQDSCEVHTKKPGGGAKDKVRGESSKDASRKASRQNMFFIEPAESDSESSSADSFHNFGSHAASSEDGSTGVNSQPSSPATIHEEISGSANISSGGGNDDEWDDISADEDDDEEEDKDANSERNELRKRAMFRERKVPTNPSLKRSLLSSLFLDKMKRSPSTPSESNSSESSSQYNGITINPTSKSGILNGGTPTKASPKSAISTGTEWSEIGAPGVQKPLSRRRSTLTRTQSENITASFGSNPGTLSSSSNQLCITARPEMYRASTTTDIDSVSSQVEKERSDWSNQHEDIYDPMNYHSRGW